MAQCRDIKVELSDITLDLGEELKIIGRGFEIYRAILQAVQKRNGTREHMKRILNDTSLQDRIAGIVLATPVAATISVSGPFIVPVDLTRSLADMIRAGRYDNEAEALREITEERYPVDRSGELRYDAELFLASPSKDGITTTEWQAELRENGWELERPPELLALGVKYPDLQRERYIISFGSSWRDPRGLLYSPALWSGDGGRKADTSWFNVGGRWNLRSRPLVSRKRR